MSKHAAALLMAMAAALLMAMAAALLMAMAAASKSQGYALDVSCSPMDYARSLNHTKQQRIKRNGRKGK